MLAEALRLERCYQIFIWTGICNSILPTDAGIKNETDGFRKRVENTDGNSCDDASEDDSNNEGDNDATTVTL